MLRANSLRIRTGNSFHRTGKFHRRTGIALLFFTFGTTRDAGAVTHSIPAARPCRLPRSTIGRPARSVLMVKCNPSSRATLQRGKGELHMWLGVEIRSVRLRQIWRHRSARTQELAEFALPQLTSNGVEFRPSHCPIIPVNVRQLGCSFPPPLLAGSSRSCPSRLRQAPFETGRTP